MTYVLIKVVGFVDGTPCPIAGQFLEAFEVDANGGRGWGEFTLDPGKAMKFKTVSAALEKWREQSRIRPLRADGRPNRPMTSTTIEIVHLKEEER